MKSKKQSVDNKDLFDEFPDKLTGLLENLIPERKERDSDKMEPEEDPYMEELKRKRRARYEAIKEKYKD